jgi:PAS domain S-box-containing protein
MRYPVRILPTRGFGVDTSVEPAADEAARLRGCLNDLVSIMALPALWAGSEPPHILGTLMDALVGMLRLAFVVVRPNDPEDGHPIEMVRVAESMGGTARARDISAAIDSALGDAPRTWPSRVQLSIGDLELSVASVRLGLDGALGGVAAGSQRSDFPAETERLLLDVAANQAAIGLQQARLLREQTRRANESERESRLIVDNIPGLVALLSPTGYVEVVNRQLLEYFGQTLEELRQWGTNGTVHPEDLPHVVDVFTRSITTGTPYEIVQRLRRADGIYRWIQNSGFPLRDTNGQIARWCVLLTDIDDRKHAEEALLKREHELRLLVETIPALMWRGTPEGELDYLNERAVEYLGHTAESLSGGRWLELVHPDHRDATVQRWLHSATTGSSYDDVYKLRRADGQYRWIQSVGEPFHDGEGRIAHWYGLVIDIDDLKRAEEALRESERESRLIVDSIPGLVAVLTPAGELDGVNNRLVEYCGRPVEELRHWAANDTLHPEDRPRVIQLFADLITSGLPSEWESRIRRFDGVYRWFQCRGLPLRDATERVVRWYVLLTDIDDLKRAEAELRRAYDSFADAQRLSKTGSFITDLVGDDHNWSEEAYRIFEFDPATKVTVQRVRDVIHPDDLPAFESVIARGMTGVNVNFAFRIVTGRGAAKHVRGVAHVVEQVAGRPMFVGALQDVTETKVAEEALNRAGAELAHVSRVTTLSALTASIAHEVNQPLSGIITNAGTCLRMLDAVPPNIDGARETARRTIRDGNRASDVIKRLRALFSKREFTPEPLDLNEATREVIALSWNELQRNRVILQSELADNLPMVTGDRIQLQQVILNLIRNASDAMVDVNDRPRQLLIKTEWDDGNRVRVTVRDAGAGLPLQGADSVFDAFFTTKSGGMGIGLFVSRSIIERHHGRLWSEPNAGGPGATFSFSIPHDREGALKTSTNTKV